jgi:hypothetical protein
VTAPDVDDEAAHRQANAIRSRLLAAADWAELGSALCNPGTLRAFSRDTSTQAFDELTHHMTKLEGLIVARGVDQPINTPTAHALLRVVIEWEAGQARPKWDVPAGEPAREAIAAGLAGEFQDPTTGQCDAYVRFDTVALILPPEAGELRLPVLKDVYLKAYVGETGLKAARDTFYAHVERHADPVFTYTKISPVVVWRDFAVVTVNRPAEDRATVPLPQGAGGATYIFHRVGTEWRLLVISRSWG